MRMLASHCFFRWTTARAGRDRFPLIPSFSFKRRFKSSSSLITGGTKSSHFADRIAAKGCPRGGAVTSSGPGPACSTFSSLANAPPSPFDLPKQSRQTRFRLTDVSINRSSGTVDVSWADGASSQFHHFWLRDNCHCSQCKEPSSQQKLRSCADVDLAIEPVSVQIVGNGNEIRVEWPDTQHGQSQFSSDWLRLQRYDDESLAALDAACQPCTWTASTLSADDIPEVAFDDVMQTDEGLYRWLHHLQETGLCVVSGAPQATGHVAPLASRAANVRRTIYGSSDWDVRVEADPVNVAYTAVPLPAHMDLLYYECPPGIQLLHFVRTEAAGGANFFVDAFAAAEQLARDAPDAFAVLCANPLDYHKRDRDHWMHATRPAIETDKYGRVSAVSFAPPFEAPIRAPFAQMRALYQAYAKFDAVLQSPDLCIRRRFVSGDVITFNNRRIMHGRESIQADEESSELAAPPLHNNQPSRLLQGCYIDLDETASTFRVLQNRYGDPKDPFQGFTDKF